MKYIISPPRGYRGSPLKIWYRRVLGYLPFDWRQHPAVAVYGQIELFNTINKLYKR